jgi:hypothetical protein
MFRVSNAAGFPVGALTAEGRAARDELGQSHFRTRSARPQTWGPMLSEFALRVGTGLGAPMWHGLSDANFGGTASFVPEPAAVTSRRLYFALEAPNV